MNAGKDVETILSLDFTNSDYTYIHIQIPEAWREKGIGQELKALSNLYHLGFHTNPVYSITLKMGLLRILVNTGDPIYDAAWEMASQKTAQKTAIICMVCGERGMRRKKEEGMPCLCRPHYVEYANYLADKEGID